MIKELDLDSRVIGLVAGGMIKKKIAPEALNTTVTTDQTERSKLIIIGSSAAITLVLTGAAVYFAYNNPEAISEYLDKITSTLVSRAFIVSGVLALLKSIGYSATALCVVGTIMYTADANT